MIGKVIVDIVYTRHNNHSHKIWEGYILRPLTTGRNILIVNNKGEIILTTTQVKKIDGDIYETEFTKYRIRSVSNIRKEKINKILDV